MISFRIEVVIGDCSLNWVVSSCTVLLRSRTGGKGMVVTASIVPRGVAVIIPIISSFVEFGLKIEAKKRIIIVSAIFLLILS